MHLKRNLAGLMAGILTLTSVMPWAGEAGEVQAATVSLTKSDRAKVYQSQNYTRQSVHDPSIVVQGDEYYVFGTEMGVAKTTDLRNWKLSAISGQRTDSAYYGKLGSDGTTVTAVSYEKAFQSNATAKIKNNSGIMVDFGSYDITAWLHGNTVGGNMWAPDVIWNEVMQKWCMYQSLNGDNWASTIVLLTADDIEGPYVYQGPVVFTGFQSANASGANANGGYAATDLSIALGSLASLPDRYDKSAWGDYWPHAIDPCVFYDDDGKLWLSYGSWSGGIYMLELDETTGLRDYTVSYPLTYFDNSDEKTVTSDPYFGKKIAGGCYVSGEGSYIEKIGDYYFLFVSYGFYAPTGGYNMRVFRSEKPDGPYVDMNGKSPIYTGWVDNFRYTSRGLQLMGNYQWGKMDIAEIAQGHNSALLDEDGNAYLIYHTKFGDDTSGHELRVHQLYLNEDGWIVAAPYEYAGEENKADALPEVNTADIPGVYELLIHEYNNQNATYDGIGTVAEKVSIADGQFVTLTTDGKIRRGSNELGTWSHTPGGAYASFVVDGTEYKGVFTHQHMDDSTGEAFCFSGMCSNGNCLWAAKYDEAAVVLEDYAFPDAVTSDLALYGEHSFGGTFLSWDSSDDSVIDETGRVAWSESDVDVTLTRMISRNGNIYRSDYPVTVYGAESDNHDVLIYYNDLQNGDKLMPVEVSAETGVSIEFRTSVSSDWDPVFLTGNGEHIFLSVLNYATANIFESAGTVSAAASSAGYHAGNAWTIFSDNVSYDVTISYNTDGSISFYRNGVKMLTYSADTAIGTYTVKDLCQAVIQSVAEGKLIVKRSMTDVAVRYAKDYEYPATGCVKAKQSGTAYLDAGGEVTVSFQTDKAFTGAEKVTLDGAEASAGTEKGFATVTDITRESGIIRVTLHVAAISGWHKLSAPVLALTDAGDKTLARSTLRYSLDEPSEEGGFRQIAATAENDYTRAYFKRAGTKLTFITIIRSPYIHADGVEAGGTTYGWYNGICSELYLTLDGVRYSVGSHLYLDKFANSIAWGEGVNTSLINGESATRAYLAYGSFDDDTNLDIGCALLTVVDLADAGLEETELEEKTVSFSGYIGPNDGGVRFAQIDEAAEYPLSHVHVWNEGGITTEATCTEAGVKSYTCTVCGETKTEEIAARGHDYSIPEYQWSDGGKSCKVTLICSHDGTHQVAGEAAITSTVKEESTCVEKGTTTYTAIYTYGGKEYQDSKEVKDIAINPENHTGGTELRNAKEATTSEAGYTGDTYCLDCGTLIVEGTPTAKLEDTQDTEDNNDSDVIDLGGGTDATTGTGSTTPATGTDTADTGSTTPATGTDTADTGSTAPAENDTVDAAELTLSISKATLYTGKVKNTVTVTAETTGESNKVTWTTSNKKVATVKNGVITAVGKGTATIKAKANGITEKVKITVKNPTIKILNAKKKSVTKASIKKGKSAKLTIKISPDKSGMTVTKLSAKAQKIAAVTLKNGTLTVKGKKAGTIKITIKSAGAAKKLKITVKK